jgi:molybdopterin/thiamine biosynthesis adenylyltransferase/rhodanese-related sulfurtransferase
MEEWLRYSCQLALPGFGKQAQEKLQNAKVLIVGAGGLGCPAAQYIVSSGVGHVTIADPDTISISNLHRQILYNSSDVGKLKVDIARERLKQLNEQAEVTAFDQMITAKNVMDLISDYNVVVDCTDNIESRYLLNDACVLLQKPLVYGSIYQYEGHLAVWNNKNEDGTFTANYRDVFPDVNSAALPNCNEGGVLPALAGIIGSMQAVEVIKLLTGCGEVLSGKMLVFDSTNMQSRIIRLGRISTVKISGLSTGSQVKAISAVDLSELIKQNKVQLIDVREKEEHTAFNIGGKNIPLNRIDSIEITNGEAVVLYCESGRRSGNASRILTAKFPAAHILSLEGGMNKWKEIFKNEFV